jgi:hypothetical protein
LRESNLTKNTKTIQKWEKSRKARGGGREEQEMGEGQTTPP